MNLAEIELTSAQAAAFLRLLDREVLAEETRLAKAERAIEEEETSNRRYEKICELARQTARTNGVIEGLSASYAAAATWEAFIACEGWFSPFDVDDYWMDRNDDTFREGWELAYVEEIEQMMNARRVA